MNIKKVPTTGAGSRPKRPETKTAIPAPFKLLYKSQARMAQQISESEKDQKYGPKCSRLKTELQQLLNVGKQDLADLSKQLRQDPKTKPQLLPLIKALIGLCINERSLLLRLENLELLAGEAEDQRSETWIKVRPPDESEREELSDLNESDAKYEANVSRRQNEPSTKVYPEEFLRGTIPPPPRRK